jgi:hypothetical protein
VTTIDAMWAALEAHKPERLRAAKAWERMCRNRTYDAVAKALEAAPVWSAAEVALRWALTAIETQARADRHAQEAIDAIKEVKP